MCIFRLFGVYRGLLDPKKNNKRGSRFTAVGPKTVRKNKTFLSVGGERRLSESARRRESGARANTAAGRGTRRFHESTKQLSLVRFSLEVLVERNPLRGKLLRQPYSSRLFSQSNG